MQEIYQEYQLARLIWNLNSDMMTRQMGSDHTHTNMAIYRGQQHKTTVVFENNSEVEAWQWRMRKINGYVRVSQHLFELYESVSDMLDDEIKMDQTLTFSGFGKGGALAQLAAYVHKRQHPGKHIECLAFSSPRVGNLGFARAFDQGIDKGVRVYYGHDPMPNQPSTWLGYWHTSNVIHLHHNGQTSHRDPLLWPHSRRNFDHNSLMMNLFFTNHVTTRDSNT